MRSVLGGLEEVEVELPVIIYWAAVGKE